MTTPIVKSLIDEQVESLAAAFNLPRETRVLDLPNPIKGAWQTPPSESMKFVMGNFGYDLRGRLVML
jgi:hypothetical protein